MIVSDPAAEVPPTTVNGVIVMPLTMGALTYRLAVTVAAASVADIVAFI